MSTRRTTRATSKQASSRGASPAISTSDIPATPRRTTRRAGNAPLPALGLRTSTAYGTNSIQQAGRVAGPQVSEQLNSVLSNLLNPIRENDVVSHVSSQHTGKNGQRADSTPLDRSYQHESGIFRAAGIESSEINEESDLDNYSESLSPSLEDQNDHAQEEALRMLAEQRVEQARAIQTADNSPLEDLVGSVKTYASLVWDKFGLILSPFGFALTAVVLVTAVIMSAPADGYHFYGFDIKHNIGQFIPYSLSHPIDYFSSDDIQDIHKRLTSLEYQVANIKSSTSGIDPKTITKLSKMLPDLLVVKKDRNGNLAIPDDFWHALQDRIRSDHTIFSDQVREPTKGSGQTTSISVREVAGEVWEKYIKVNLAKMETLSDGELTLKFPELLKRNQVVTRDDIIQMIRENWDDNHGEVKSQIQQLTKKLENITRQISKLQHDPSSLSNKEKKQIADSISRTVLESAQLQALAKANLQNTVNHGLKQLNHFSKGTGAIIDPTLTSPDYIFPSMDVWFTTRWLRSLILNPIPAPNPADAALTKWDEHGDCWCSPARDSNGFGPSLAVIMGSYIYPDQVVVEHIASSAALQPGAAPKEMELLAHFPDPSTYAAVKTASDEIFKDEARTDIDPKKNFVRIATWTYDIDSPFNVQSFPVQLKIGATNKVIVRAKNNWGGDRVDYTCLYRVRVHGDSASPPGSS